MPRWDVEDAIQDGIVGLWRASRRWTPDGGVTFDQWCRRSIRPAIIDGQRNRTGWRRRHPPVTLVPVTERDLPIFDADDPERRAMVSAAIRDVRSHLDHADSVVFDGLIAGRTMRDIGTTLGVSEARVSQRVKVLRETVERAVSP